jgi:CBS domain-containing protein
LALLAKDVMQAQMITVEPDLSAVELGRLFHREHISGAPVVAQGRLVGVVSQADLAHALAEADERAEATLYYYQELSGASPDWSSRAHLAGERTEHLRVRDLMSDAVLSVSPDLPLREVARELVQHGVHRLLVVEGQRLLGIVSAFDVVRLVADGRLAEDGR